MSEERLNELLNTLPGDDEITFRAARARHRAMARLDEPEPEKAPWFLAWNWGPALTVAAALLIFAGVVFQAGRPSAPAKLAMTAPAAREEPESLRMKWVLEDGTRVIWTFREDF